MLLKTLGARLLIRMLMGKRILRAGYRNEKRRGICFK